MLRKLTAEAVGTALLLAAVVGSGIMAERLAAGNAALALLGNTLATGAVLVVLIRMFGPVSGAHFNPAVTLVFAVRRDMDARLAVAYAFVQVIGAVAGVWLAHLMFGMPVFEISHKMRTGAAQQVSEAVATFGLVATILLTLKADAKFVPVAVGLYITAAYWFTASTSFANPAVTLARCLSDSFAGIRPADAPGFIAAQIAGSLVSFAFCKWLLGRETDARAVS